MKERIKAIRKESGLTMTEFGKRLGVSMNYVYMMESGRREPSTATARELCRQFSIDEHWLATGEGEMHRRKTISEAAEAVSSLLANEPDSPAAAVITELLALDPHGPEWEVIGALIQRIFAQMKKDPES